jgi:sterol desaturase/sphingolipid hydroxylase (fatty acid hydroxylase superfamily)
MSPVVVVGFTALALIALERRIPGVEQPRVPNWLLRVAALNSAQIAVVYIGVLTWDRWLSRLSPWNGQMHGGAIWILLGYVAITFVYYWWHRARHEIPVLWRWFHQVHHSPARIEVVTSFYKHPLEIAVNGLLSSTVLHVLVGLTPASAAIVVTITGIAELFYHCNVRTPYWLGFVFQRPESHRRHHELNIHRGNYSDLPLWDIIFGTFDNPRKTPRTCGFGRQRETELLRMLMGGVPR